MNEEVWHPTVFTKNRDRLLEGEIAEEFFRVVLRQARRKKLLSDEHFTVDGTLIEAWAGQKSFQLKDDDDILKPPPDPGSNPTIDYRKHKRSNDTHQSKTDPLARLYKKSRGSEAKLAYLGHILTENRNGLVVNTRVTLATGTAERDAAIQMAEQIPGGSKRVTLGADRGYDTADFVEQMKEFRVTPHGAQNDTHRRSAIDARTTNQPGYTISQRKRKRLEEVFGWMKTIALQRKTRFRGPDKIGWMFTFAAAAYNLVRMRNLLPQPV
jgi:IS5 family transposase